MEREKKKHGKLIHRRVYHTIAPLSTVRKFIGTVRKSKRQQAALQSTSIQRIHSTRPKSSLSSSSSITFGRECSSWIGCRSLFHWKKPWSAFFDSGFHAVRVVVPPPVHTYFMVWPVSLSIIVIVVVMPGRGRHAMCHVGA
jgi:hypothetical protein